MSEAELGMPTMRHPKRYNIRPWKRCPANGEKRRIALSDAHRGAQAADPASLVRAFQAVARQILLKWFVPNSCITATRIAVDCMAHFGISAHGVNTLFTCSCASLALSYVAGADEAERRRFCILATGINADLPYRVPGFTGHVVAIAGRCLVDPTFDQASLPDHGLVIPPRILVVPLAPEDDPYKLHIKQQIVIENGVQLHVQYISLPSRGFMDTPAWNAELSDPIAEICRAMARFLEP